MSYEEWKSFLSRYIVPKGTDGAVLTHVSMIAPKQRFSVPPSAMPEFWRLYCSLRLLPTCPPLGMLELSTPSIPVLADFDMKVEYAEDSEETAQAFDEGFVQKVVRVYQKVLSEDFDVAEPNLICFILRKEPYVLERNGTFFRKYGFHLHFPKVFMARRLQELQLIPRVKSAFYASHGQSLDAVLDKAYCRGNGGPWLLYGSRKDPSLEPYLISGLVTSDGRCVGAPEWRQEFVRCGYGLVTSSSDAEDVVAKTETVDGGNLELLIPRILSTIIAGREQYMVDICANASPVRPSSSLRNCAPPNPRRKSGMHGDGSAKEQGSSMSKSDIETSMDMIRELVDLVKTERAKDRNEWIRMGWILFNICEDGQAGLETWMRFSQRCPALFDEKTCQWEWSQMKKANVSLGSLKYIARNDDPEGYDDLMRKYVQPHIQESLSFNGTHNDIAQALFQKYQDQYVCASIRDRLWYTFSNPVWHVVEEGFSLRAKISGEVVKEYQRLVEARRREFANSDDVMDQEEQKKQRRKVEAILKVIGQLKSAPYKTNVMKEASEIFFQPAFLKRLDSDPLLFTFQNGVMDLRTFAFREGRPEDFQSMQAPVKYCTDLHDRHPDVVQVHDFLMKIFPDRSVRDYFMDVSADVFLGGNSSKLIQFWSGEGDNGKSVTQTLFEKMLGPYAIKLPTSLITGKRTQSSSASPELARAGNGVRLAMLQEPDQKDVLNIGLLKELSGNDTFFARGLYKEGSEIRPMFKLVLVCNEPPKLPYNDRATWNRIRVIPFESTFTDEAPASLEEQLLTKKFPKDKRFSEKIPKMIEAFAWCLVQRLRRRPAGYVQFEPDKVRLATANYQRRNDIYRQFVDEMIATVATDSELSLIEVYAVFKDWFRESVPGGMLPTKTEVRDYLCKTWGAPDMARGRSITWKGKRFVEQQAPSSGATAPSSDGVMFTEPPPSTPLNQEEVIY